jgi:hypothetical protein
MRCPVRIRGGRHRRGRLEFRSATIARLPGGDRRISGELHRFPSGEWFRLAGRWLTRGLIHYPHRRKDGTVVDFERGSQGRSRHKLVFRYGDVTRTAWRS